ncbi:MAG TPA: hypothetical protein VNU24_06910 [Solirubrobacteraceae bacterium]|nr:hypothetical protein [Solirubrobacteraceae bacterium]
MSALALTCAALLGASLAPAGAGAAADKPFAITGFSMQTTQAEPVSSGYGYANVPYPFTQAGGHPDGLTSTIEFASEETSEANFAPTQPPREMVIDLPPGFSANPLAVSRCPRAQAVVTANCPNDSQVGTFVMRYGGNQALFGPIVDMVTQGGEPAELGLEIAGKLTFPLTGHIVRTPAGYGLALIANGLPMLEVTAVETTLWGVPADTVHDPLRGLSCSAVAVQQQWSCEGGGAESGEPAVPFLTMPSDCSAGTQTAVGWADSWDEPGRYVSAQAQLPAVSGCELLPFASEVQVEPDTQLADEPVGVSAIIAAPQDRDGQTSAPPLRSAHVALAPGISISPAVANGLRACAREGPEGIDIPTGLNAAGQALRPGEIGEGEELGPGGEAQLAPGHCPSASTVGSVEALSPLVASPIRGRVYLAAPGCGGAGQGGCGPADALDGNLYRLYVELGGEPGEGVDVKLEAQVQANPATGQLSLVLMEGPQLTISRLSIVLSGGPSALLDNPASCGTAQSVADLQAWSAPGTTPPPESLLVPGTADASPSSFYQVTGCAATPSLHPGFLAGTVTPQAGAFSAFTFTVTRGDREPYLSQIQTQAPPGLSAMLASVPLCEAALARSGRCPQASLIGSTLIASGAGSHPLEMPGRIYLSAGYDGAPFGLSIVTEAVAGPLDLGDVVIRARVDVNPQTAAITITSDPLPQILLGVPLRLQKVTLDIDRPGFMFNPTNCKGLQVRATITDTQGTSAQASNPFAAAGCNGLAFQPKLSASTNAHASYASGASLDVKLAFPHTEQGSEANLARVKLTLPGRLSSRLSALQGACLRNSFQANPATCPKTSVLGIARARTPVLAGELVGPVYLVAHGHDALPSLALVLQEDGVSLVLTGSTSIGKSELSSISFDGLPDLPIGSLELYLPSGAHSLLSAGGSLCAPSRTAMSRRDVLAIVHGRAVRRVVKVPKPARAGLLMPTELLAQNGAVVHQSTKIEVSGCTAAAHR